MASIGMVAETEATERIQGIYLDIKSTLGIDFVPNLYKVMAAKPDYLEATWGRVKAIMVRPGRLDRLSKEIIALSVSAVMGCRY